MEHWWHTNEKPKSVTLQVSGTSVNKPHDTLTNLTNALWNVDKNWRAGWVFVGTYSFTEADIESREIIRPFIESFG